MSAEWLTYPFLFLAIFFESFILVTFLSSPARKARRRLLGASEPSVAIIVPCFNEASTIRGTVDSLLALSYPQEKLSLILVNDGSTDGTKAVIESFKNLPNVSIIHKENGGKHTALNVGLEATTAEIIGCLDADSFVEPDALTESVAGFTHTNVGAVTAAMTIHEPGNLLQHMQNAEYLFGVLIRHVLASINGLYVTPGPFSLYRRELIIKLGGFKHGHQTEDLEMALRLQKAGYEIENAPSARVYTKAPKTLHALIRQRVRWTSGFLRNVFYEYRSLLGNPRYGALGTLILPLAVLSIGSSVLLFVLSVSLFATNTYAAYQIRAGIPLSYSLVPHNFAFDWFYTPGSTYLLLGIITIFATLYLMMAGKRISKNTTSLVRGFFAYLLLYGFIAPLWLARSAADVAIGKKRSWR